MEYYNGALCISARELIDSGAVTEANYRSLAHRGRIRIVRRGGGAAGQHALIDFDSMPEQLRAKVKTLTTDSARVRLAGWIRRNYQTDQQAVVFFSSPHLCGVTLPPERIREYITNASVLNTAILLYNRAAEAQRIFGAKYNWDMMADTIETLRQLYAHTLPSSTLRFRQKVAQYRRDGYKCLITRKFGNQQARKVSAPTERLIIALAALSNKPYNTNVAQLYNQFVKHQLQVADTTTGELFHPEDFTGRDGRPLTLSEATIQHYISLPRNQVLIAHATTSWTTFLHEQTPHVHRHAPEFSLSKISLDDRDLPRKLADTHQRLKAYYAYDVASQCVIGYAYSRRKDQQLVIECFRSMFRLIHQNGWGCPAQVEVENHLMSQWRDTFLRADTLFPFVRFCAPQNSQEKYAEQLNGAKKRAIEHRNHNGIGRFYARDPHYRTEAKKIADETNELYNDQQYYTLEQLVADDLRDIQQYNHSLHPNQRRYPGLTRWQVLTQNINPTLRPLDQAVIARYIGEHVRTTIRRNSYCRILHRDWWISSTEVIDRLRPGDYQVDAYYIPESSITATSISQEPASPSAPSDHSAPSDPSDHSDHSAHSDRVRAEHHPTAIYIYQGDRFIDQLRDIGTFNTADAEQTPHDREVFTQQQAHIAHFRRYVADRTPAPLAIQPAPQQPPTPQQLLTSQQPPTPQQPSESDRVRADYARKAFEDY